MCMYSPIKNTLKKAILVLSIALLLSPVFASQEVASYDLYLITGHEDTVLYHTDFGISDTLPDLSKERVSAEQNMTLRIEEDTDVINTSYIWWRLRSGKESRFTISLSLDSFELENNPAYQIETDIFMDEPITLYGCSADISREEVCVDIKNKYVNFSGIIPVVIKTENESLDSFPAGKYFSTGKVTICIN